MSGSGKNFYGTGGKKVNVELSERLIPRESSFPVLAPVSAGPPLTCPSFKQLFSCCCCFRKTLEKSAVNGSVQNPTPQ